MAEQCAFCGNKHLTAKTTRYLHRHGEELLFVEHVPCVECDFCGEQYFDIAVLKKIEADHLEIAEQRKLPQRYLRVAVEEFKAPAGIAL
ncbi:MAG: YgiT-type zinc finger domain-containing protein [Candidatus Methylumidiphilus alinenensis]|uniref:YgiT-type zinc finger domain-containing protein n=1 Tax=Candidatus Methylumidiphilus alinenensis TaxID=2202197 RepID=A0A2W4QS50_9GAMM|nr:MAG: YgiT-type zinc finger domain-containing protein [Candidatus Methylumidiphilus alinenensis]